MTEETLKAVADKVYKYIHEYLMEHAKPPTHREIIEGLKAEGTAICTETLAKALNELERQERPIHRVRGRGRQLWVPIPECPDEKED